MNINIEDFIPHRDRMKLIDTVIDLDDNKAVTASTVTDRWSLYKEGFVNPIVLIELVAQTSGIIGGWENLKAGNKDNGSKGWIVGIKKASFYIEKIPLGSCIITIAENRFAGYENFIEVEGKTEIGDNLIGEIILQVIKFDDNFVSTSSTAMFRQAQQPCFGKLNNHISTGSTNVLIIYAKDI